MLSRRLLLVALFTCVTLGFTILVAEQGIRNYLPSDAFPEANGVLFGGDYLAFYVGGRLFIEDRDRLYDLDYQEEYRTALLGPIPESVSSHLPFVYPPLVGALMAPFSKLPFRQSFWTWMVLGLGVSLFSLALIARTFRAHEIVPLPLILLYSLGFVPFSLNTLLGGQISWLGLAIFAMVGTAISNRKPFLAGLVMSLSYYKPPLFLLLLIVLLLSQGRRFFWGFAVGATALISLSLALVGTDGLASYLGMVSNYQYGRELVPGGSVPAVYGMGLVSLGFTFFSSMKATLVALALPFLACTAIIVRLLRSHEEEATLLGLILCFSASAAFSLQIGKYDLALLLVPMVLVLAWIRKGPSLGKTLALIFFVGFYFEFAARGFRIGGEVFNLSAFLLVALLGTLCHYAVVSGRLLRPQTADSPVSADA